MSAHAAPADGLQGRRRWLSTLANVLGVVSTVLANATLYVALPDMSQALGLGAGATVWILNAYLLATVVALLPAAALGDSRGHRTLFLAGLALFALATLVATLSAWSPWPLATLLAARAGMGLGAAGVMASSMALLRATHPRARMGRFMGFNGMAVAAANAAGPSLAGLVLELGSWQWLLALLLLPVGLAALAGWRSLPPNPVLRDSAPDALGSACQALGLSALLLACTPQAGPWRGPLALLGLAAALVFVRREARRGFALLPLDLLRRPLFAASFAAAWACFVAQMLALVCLPFFIQQRLGLGPGDTGLAMTPWPLAVMLMAPIAGALSDRLSTAVLGSVGLLLAAGGLGLVALLPEGAGLAGVAWRSGLIGVGFSLFTGSNARALMAATPIERSGAVGGLHAMSRQSGQMAGAALAGAVLGPAALLAGAGPARGLLLAAAVSVLAALACGLKAREARAP